MTLYCPECGGEGYKPEKNCNVCKGEGRVKSEEKIKVFIPAGVDSNQIIKVEQKGEAGRKGGRAGDLYIRIYILLIIFSIFLKLKLMCIK